MLSRKQLKEYRELRGLSYREVSNYCDVSHTCVSLIEKGERDLTKRCHDEIVKGINACYAAKKEAAKATKKAEPKPETKEAPKEGVKEEVKPAVKKTTRKTTRKTASK